MRISLQAVIHCYPISNDTHPSMLSEPLSNGPAVRDSQWDGKVIKLQKFNGTLYEYGMLASLTISGTYYSHCEWKKMPRMVAALIKEGIGSEKWVSTTACRP
jgi:hypothetical protein